MSNFPFQRVNWITSSFLTGTLLIALTAAPAYVWHYGLDWFQVGMFVFYYFATGFSITLGYHRLFSHRAFKAAWPVRLFTALFGAAAFENSILDWSADHREHHKHVDHEDDDPYSIKRGFFWAHMGWLMFKLKPHDDKFSNVPDLKKDPIIVWQHDYVQWIALVVGLILPAVLGYFWNGWEGALGGFLIAGVTRTVLVQQATFFINSLCHTLGSRPYSTRCTARDSWLMALFTYGEGYHNYHHEFQHDYRNGVKAWQFDPTKWIIWTLSKLGLAWDLRRVPQEKIIHAQIKERQRLLKKRVKAGALSISESADRVLTEAQEALQQATDRVLAAKEAYVKASKHASDYSQAQLAELRRKIEVAKGEFETCRQNWESSFDQAVCGAV